MIWRWGTCGRIESVVVGLTITIRNLISMYFMPRADLAVIKLTLLLQGGLFPVDWQAASIVQAKNQHYFTEDCCNALRRFLAHTANVIFPVEICFVSFSVLY